MLKQYVKWDDEFNAILVIFGTDRQIKQGNIDGIYNLPDVEFDKLEQLKDDLHDTGAGCEDYLITCGGPYDTQDKLDAVRQIVDSSGIPSDPGLENASWG